MRLKRLALIAGLIGLFSMPSAGLIDKKQDFFPPNRDCFKTLTMEQYLHKNLPEVRQRDMQYDADSKTLIIRHMPIENWTVTIGNNEESPQQEDIKILGPRKVYRALEALYRSTLEIAINGTESEQRRRYNLGVKIKGNKVTVDDFPIDFWETDVIDTDLDGYADLINPKCSKDTGERLKRLYHEIQSRPFHEDYRLLNYKFLNSYGLN